MKGKPLILLLIKTFFLFFFFLKLFSLMDMKPPISRAKMILITKAAIKAIKVRVKEIY